MYKALKFAAGLLAIVAAAGCSNAELKLTPGNIDKVVAAMTDEEKAHLLVGGGQKDVVDSTVQLEIAACREMVPGCAGFTYPIPRLGIPAIVFADGPAGLRIAPTREGTGKTFYCTGFPIGSLLASSWDPALVEEVGEAIGDEVLHYGVDVLLAPGLNIHRNPLCGRNFEYYSEDPLLSGKMAAAYVRGVQSAGVGTSAKHFAANSQELNRLSNDSRVSQRALRELYLKNFEITVKESDPWTIMTSYNYLNGMYTSEHPELLEDILRGEWGYKGTVISDWGGGNDAPAQIHAGNEFLAPGQDFQYNDILAAIRDGSLPGEEVDRSVKRMLQLIVRTPAFKGYEHDDDPDLEAHSRVARRAASEGMVLLENNGDALPLKEGSTVALFGANSYKLIAGGTGAGDVNKAYTINLDEGLRAAGVTLEKTAGEAYGAHVLKEAERLAPINEDRGWWFGELPLEELPGKELAGILPGAAALADAAVVTIVRQAGEGRDRLPEEGDWLLDEDEKALLDAVEDAFHKEGKKVIVVLNTGGVIETASWKDGADAILLAWQAGQESGHAIADILTGKVNPSGCLPATFPVKYADVPSQNFPLVKLPEKKNGSWWHHKKGQRWYDIKDIDYTDYLEDIYVGYRYYDSFGVEVAYPFGYGLSYTSFALGGTSVKGNAGGWTVSVPVRNAGQTGGKCVVQVYFHTPGQLNVPERQLLCFAKTGILAPGEETTVTMSVTARDLAYWDEGRSAWVTPAGDYSLDVITGDYQELSPATLTVAKENVVPAGDLLRPKNADGSPTDRPLYIDGGTPLRRQ